MGNRKCFFLFLLLLSTLSCYTNINPC
jgi:hypothetical protein